MGLWDQNLAEFPNYFWCQLMERPVPFDFFSLLFSELQQRTGAGTCSKSQGPSLDLQRIPSAFCRVNKERPQTTLQNWGSSKNVRIPRSRVFFGLTLLSWSPGSSCQFFHRISGTGRDRLGPEAAAGRRRLSFLGFFPYLAPWWNLGKRGALWASRHSLIQGALGTVVDRFQRSKWDLVARCSEFDWSRNAWNV